MPPEQDPFIQLIEDNKALIFKICNAYCRHPADREDLAQEIIFTLWKGRGRFQPDHKFSTWLYRVALNVAISYYRKTKKATTNIPLSDIHTDQLAHADPVKDEEDKQQMLVQEIAALKEFDKALIILYLEEKSYKEIAEIIGITETNVATKLSRIKEKIKQNITNHTRK
ncbi:MAG TPA: sigma-70 family RNA polymerase sigma factor [Chitinophagaceae bacterium]|jgi:RNA polymerase sigma-70 factor (ECF subfamily)|nr:sigma-70 family RNA polymerase sigma factor [Chitinophagaceae bacterium]